MEKKLWIYLSFVTMANLFVKLNYKDLLTSVKYHAAGSSIFFAGPS